jgi:hypothetical protein
MRKVFACDRRTSFSSKLCLQVVQQLLNELVVENDVLTGGEDYSDESWFHWRLFIVKHM